MSSINPHYTFNYQQPEEYKFSHDSVFLARRAFELLDTLKTKKLNVLDLCSGCGVVGLDFLFHTLKRSPDWVQHIDFIEIQNIYTPYFVQNITTLQTGVAQFPTYKLINQNYADLLTPEFKNKYDLILCNPPYFRKEHGVLSPSDFKNRCRFFLDSDYPTLIRFIENSLNPSGQALILLKDLSEHGISIENEFQSLKTGLKIENLGLIRNTHLYKFTGDPTPN